MHLCLKPRDPHLAPLACSLWILSFHTTNTCTTASLLQGTWRELNGAVPPAGPNFELGLQAAMRGVPNTSSRSDHGHGDAMVTAPWKSWAGTIGPTNLLNVFTFFAWRHSYLQAAKTLSYLCISTLTDLIAANLSTCPMSRTTSEQKHEHISRYMRIFINK